MALLPINNLGNGSGSGSPPPAESGGTPPGNTAAGGTTGGGGTPPAEGGRAASAAPVSQPAIAQSPQPVPPRPPLTEAAARSLIDSQAEMSERDAVRLAEQVARERGLNDLVERVNEVPKAGTLSLLIPPTVAAEREALAKRLSGEGDRLTRVSGGRIDTNET